MSAKKKKKELPRIVVKLDNVTVSYNRHPAVHHVSGAFRQGSLTAITGPNGAGKSTLLKTIAGVNKPSEGHVDLNGLRRHEVAYLPQVFDVERGFPMSVRQFVAMGMWAKKGFAAKMDDDCQFHVEQALKLLGLDDFMDRHIGNLSSGQFQRVMFARLIVQDAKLILLDEPFAAMDEDTTAKLLRLLGNWQEGGKTIICVVHDIEQIIARFPECLLIARELIAWGKTEDALSADNQLKARQFKESWGEDEEFCKA